MLALRTAQGVRAGRVQRALRRRRARTTTLPSSPDSRATACSSEAAIALRLTERGPVSRQRRLRSVCNIRLTGKQSLGDRAAQRLHRRLRRHGLPARARSLHQRPLARTLRAKGCSSTFLILSPVVGALDRRAARAARAIVLRRRARLGRRRDRAARAGRDRRRRGRPDRRACDRVPRQEHPFRVHLDAGRAGSYIAIVLYLIVAIFAAYLGARVGAKTAIVPMPKGDRGATSAGVRQDRRHLGDRRRAHRRDRGERISRRRR